MKPLHFLLVFLMCIHTTSAFAQFGVLDSTFGFNGKVTSKILDDAINNKQEIKSYLT